MITAAWICTLLGGAMALFVVLLALGLLYHPGIPTVYMTEYLVIFGVGVALLITGIVLFIILKVRKSKTDGAKKKKSKSNLNAEWMKPHISNAIFCSVAAAIISAVYVAVIGWIAEMNPPTSFAEHINVIGIILSAVMFAIAGATIGGFEYKDNKAFAGYHPTGHTVDETKAFLNRVFYTERGYTHSMCKLIRITAYLHILVYGVMTLFFPHLVSVLIGTIGFFLGQTVAHPSDDAYDTYISTVANCKGWRSYICRNCGILLSGKTFIGNTEDNASSSFWTETVTTTTTTTDTTYDTYTIGNTTYYDEYVDTYVDTDVTKNNYIETSHSYSSKYRCPKCKTVNYIDHNYTEKTYI